MVGCRKAIKIGDRFLALRDMNGSSVQKGTLHPSPVQDYSLLSPTWITRCGNLREDGLWQVICVDCCRRTGLLW